MGYQIRVGHRNFLGSGDFLKDEICAKICYGTLGGDGENLLLAFHHLFFGCALVAAFLDQAIGLILCLAHHDFVR